MHRRLILLMLGLAVLVVGWLLIDAGEPGSPTLDEEDPGSAGRVPDLAITAPAPTHDGPHERAAGGARIQGTVEDEEGHLIGGVPVVLERHVERAFLDTAPGRWLATEASGQPERYDLVATTRTDADGVFAFSGVPWDARELRLRADAEPPWTVCEKSLYAVKPHTWVRLVLMRGMPLRLRVVSVDGNGLAATVTGYRDRDRVPWFPATFLDRPTDADGHLTVRVPEGRYVVGVCVPGVGMRTGLVVETPQSREVVITMGEAGGATLAGTLTDPSKRPVAGARILVAAAPRPGEHVNLLATSTAGGAYRIGGLPPGSLETIGVTAPGFVTLERHDLDIELEAGGTRRIDLTLVRGGVLEGTIRGPDGRGIAGAEVTADAEPPTPGLAEYDVAITDAAGHYRMKTVPPGAGRIRVVATGFYQPDPGRDRYVLGREGGTQRLDVTMARGVALAGRVLDVQRRPVSGAVVQARGGRRAGYWPGRRRDSTRVSDEDGRFRFPGLPPSNWILTGKTAEAQSEPVRVTLEAHGAPREDVEIVLRPCAVIGGRVVCGGRAVMEPLRVRAEADQGQKRGITPLQADGSFAIPGLAPGTYEVAAVNAELDPVTNVVRVTVDWGEEPTEVVLESWPRGCLGGVVVDPQGEAVGGVTVSLDVPPPTARRQSSVRTDSHGTFVFQDVPDSGEGYALHVEGARMPGTHKVGESDLRLVYRAPDPVRIEGKVLLPDGTPAASGHALISEHEPGRGIRTQQVTITAGRFGMTITPKSEGSTFGVEVREVFDRLGGLVSTRPFVQEHVEPGEPLEIHLVAGLSIQGVVLDPDGEPVPDVDVSLLRPGEKLPWRHKNMRTRADGTFQFGALGEGSFTILLGRAPSPWVVPDGVGVQAGDETVRITLLRGGAIRGRVSGPDGATLEGAAVTWTASGRRPLHASSNDRGEFELLRVPPALPGTLSVSPPASLQRLLLPAASKDVRAGTSSVEVRLASGALIEGEITGPKGEAVPNPTLFVHAAGASYAGSASARLTDATHFEIGPLPAGRYELFVHAEGGYLEPEPMKLEAPASRVRVVLPRGHVLQGHLLGAARPEAFSCVFYRMTPSGPVGVAGSVSASGRFSMLLKEDDVGRLYIRPREGGDQYGLVEDARPSGGPYSVRVQAGLRIEGRVEGHEAGEYAAVSVSGAGGLEASVTVAADGTFVVRALPPGTYDVHGVSAGRTLEVVRGVQAGTTGLVLRLK